MFIKSIRWRLQIWLAFLLVCTLSGFGIATFEAHRIKQYKLIDDELGRRFDILSRMARGPMFPGGRPPFDDRGRRDLRELMEGGPPGRFNDFPRPEPGNGPPLDRSENRRRFGPESRTGTNGPVLPRGDFESQMPWDFFDQLRQEDESKGIYFVIWNRDGSRLDGQTNAPGDLILPPPTGPADSGPHFRTRGNYREALDFNREGRCVLVGRSIESELMATRSFLAVLIGAGVAILTLGLAGGWLIASRAIRPVDAISATATRISAGHLSERINVADTDSELGQLAVTLNSTFARLDAAFARQQQFTADASHELRTPIAVLISEAQTTLTRERTAPEYRETIEACLDAAQQMRRLTESLLELAKLDASQPPLQRAALDLATLARERVEFIRPLAEARGLRITCKLSSAAVQANADHLGLVINNLLSNAIHYNKPNGEIAVTTGVEAGKVFLSVSDTGHGIATGDLPFIFDRFYRADKSRTRTDGRSGLGLAICKAIVEAHGGSIHVSSELGQGTTFTVCLPT